MATYSAQCSAVGSFAYSSYFKLYVVLTETNVSIENNTSKVQYNVYCQSSGSGSINANHYLYFNINGSDKRNETVKVNVSSPNAYIQIASGTTDAITHNDDGSKSISFSAQIKASSYGVSASLSDTFTLTTIARASSVSGGSGTIGSTSVISITRASSSFTHNLYFTLGNLSWQTIATGVGTSYTWTIPTSIYAQIPNSTSTTGTLICETYKNGTYIGAKTSTFTVYTSETACKPTVSGSIKDINSTTISLTGNASKLVKHKSTAQLTISSASKNSATIKSITVNGTNVGTSTSITLNYANVTTASYTIVATDSRGYSTSYVVTPSYVEYVPLTINARFYRPRPTTGEVYLTYSGNYFSGNFGTTSNSLTMTWEYKKKTDSTWIRGGTITPTISGNTISSATISLGTEFDYKTSYDFYIWAEDKLTSIQLVNTVTVGRPIFSWLKNLFIVNSNRLRLNSTGQAGDTAYFEIYKNGSRAAWFGFGNNNDNQFYFQNEVGQEMQFFNNLKWESPSYNYEDYNNFKGSGTYYMSYQNTNAPQGLNYCRMLTMGASYSGDLVQIATHVSNSRTFVRGCANGSWNPWLHIMGAEILYYNASGTNGTVTISSAASNYTYFEIFCQRNTNFYSSGLIYGPNGKSVNLTTSYATDNSTIYTYTKQISISGTSITTSRAVLAHTTGASGSVGADTANKIIAVIGYK